MLEPLPRGKLQRHAGIGHEIVLSLDVPVPQMGEQLPNIVQFFAAQLPVVAEPVIEVPKISQDRTPQRMGDRLRQPQMAEQLVDVPIVVSYSSLQQHIAEQIVDIPVPGRAGGGERGGLQGFSGQDSTAFLGAEHVDIPVPALGVADEAGKGVFAKKKSAGLGPHSGSELGADGLCRVHGNRRRRVGGGGGGRCSDSLCSFVSASTSLHAVPRAPDGTASVGVCLW